MFLKMNQDIQGDLLKHQKSPAMTFDTTRFYKTWFQELEFHKICKMLTKVWSLRPHQSSDSEPEVDTVGIYVKNHEGRNRECFIWIRIDFWDLDLRGSRLTYLRMPWFLKLVTWKNASHHCQPSKCWGISKSSPRYQQNLQRLRRPFGRV